MLTIRQDQRKVLDTGRYGPVYAVAFHPDGMHLLGGDRDGIRRWRLADGQEVGRQTGKAVYAISVSSDGNWIVCGTSYGANVWDGEPRESIINVEGTNGVAAVDVSPDSTRFATGTGIPDNKVSIWSITTGQRLVGPLQHADRVTGIKFSPDGEHIASASRLHAIRIFNSHNGDELVRINSVVSEWFPITPLAWSSDSERVFSACRDNKIRAFDSTGLQLTESLILGDLSRMGDNVYSIALAVNGKFIATVAQLSISFLDTSTLQQIGPVIEGSNLSEIRSIAISTDSSYLATGQRDGKIVIQDLSYILSDSYGPFHVSDFIILPCWISPIPSPMLTNYIDAH